MIEQEAWVVLNAISGISARKCCQLAKHFGSPVKVLSLSADDLVATGIVSFKTALNIIQFSKDKFLFDEYNLVNQKGITVLSLADQDYPSLLKEIPDPPLVLYVQGNVQALESKSLAIVGARACSIYGMRVANGFAKDFASAGYTVISGLARGIDTAVHQSVVNVKGVTIAVQGCGLMHTYPKENVSLRCSIVENKGAIISELPMTLAPMPANFPRRNRIITGLSQAIVVVEAAKKSGALISARFALEQGRDVYAVPGPIDTPFSQGTNLLIKDGAKLALSSMDILSDTGHQIAFEFQDLKERDCIRLTLQENNVYEHIHSVPLCIDELISMGFELTSLTEALLSLELKGAIIQLPGRYYVRKE